ncbi:MAG: T9SS type A sorting domain-containing protein [Bacteroidia bacterium]|nr:T9SS type A sorting domain-containing protein [Bacteroidia bacterium]
MTNRALLLFYVVIISGFYSGLVVWSTSDNLANKPTKREYSYSSGGLSENLGERHLQIWKQLRDPKTGTIPRNIRSLELRFAQTLPKRDNKVADFVWQSRGPWNVGGRTRALAMDVTNENTLIAGGVSGGIWKSIDAGQSWEKITQADQHPGVSCLVQDTRLGKTNIWYYGTGEAYGNSASASGAYFLGQGVFKSTDNGASWSVLSSTTSANTTTFDQTWDLVWNIQIDPSNTTEDEVYAATYGSIFRSINGGASWSLVRGSAFNRFSYFTDVAVTSTGVVYAALSSDGLQKGVWRSTDGVNWTNILPANFPADYERIVIGIDPNREDVVWFLAHTPNYGQKTTNFEGDEEYNSLWKYTYLSGNGSGNEGIWEERSAALPDNGGQFGNFNAQGGYNFFVKVMQGDTNMVFVGGTNLFRSTDAFKTKSLVQHCGGYKPGTVMPYFELYPNQHPDQHGIIFSPSNKKVAYSNADGGLYKTNDITASPSITWESLNRGYITCQLYTIAVNHQKHGDKTIIGGYQDNGSWWGNQASPTAVWTMPSSGDGSYCYILNDGQECYFSRQQGKMLRMNVNNQGQATGWVRIDPAGGSGYQFINPFVLNPQNERQIYLAGGKQLWFNSDVSQIPMNNTWDSTTINWQKVGDTLVTGKYSAIGVDPQTPTRVYAGTDEGQLFRIENAQSTNPTIAEITDSNFPFPGYINCIAIDPKNPDNLMIVFTNYGALSLFYSTDKGNTWTSVGGNLEQNPNGSGNGPSCRWVTIAQVDTSLWYFVGTSTGLYSTNTLNGSATTWVQEGQDVIGNTVVVMMDYRPSDGYFVVATHGSGIFETNLPVTVSRENLNSKLHSQLYPNPATNYTNLTWEGINNIPVTIILRDALGKTIWQTQHLGTGHQQIKIPLTNCSSGNYKISLQQNGIIETHQLVVIP